MNTQPVVEYILKACIEYPCPFQKHLLLSFIVSKLKMNLLWIYNESINSQRIRQTYSTK